MYSRLYRTMERFRRPEILEAAKSGLGFSFSVAFSILPFEKRKRKGKWCVAKYGDPYSEFVLCI